MTAGTKVWWQTGIIYQIYPRSFQDSNGDGVGDLRGIIQRIGYLQWLGITVVWLSPVYPSPMADFGYDISDYTGIHPLFGTMAEFDELLEQVHSHGMKLILDLVPNHTSDQHPWFLESKSSKDNPKRDWYIWKDAKADGGPPNNWRSMFGGAGWEWDGPTGQYYYHAFLKEQPDLNWRNPQVQEAMLDSMRFWLDKGVDGFRVDVMWHLIKDEQFRDNPVNRDYRPHQASYEQLLPVYSTDQPEVHRIVRLMRKLLDEYRERMMIGEIYLPVDKLVTYYGTPDEREAHLPFNFQLISLPWQAQPIAAAVDRYEGALPQQCWPNWVLGNHDQPRIASRIGLHQAKVAAMLLLTLRGTPTLYYGDELGMRDVPVLLEEMKDPQGLNMPDKALSRDPARTPMQWDGTDNAGFTRGKPWLPIEKNFRRDNVAAQKEDKDSMLNYYRELIQLRQVTPSLYEGSYAPVYADRYMISYLREAADQRFLVALNLSHGPVSFTTAHLDISGTVVLATSPDLKGYKIRDRIDLGSDEGVIIELAPLSAHPFPPGGRAQVE